MNWKKTLSYIIVLTIFWFIFRQIYFSWNDLAQYEFQLNFLTLFFSLVIIIIYFIFISLGWHKLMRYLDVRNLKKLQAIKIRTISDLGRFIPGKIWLVVGRIYLCKKKQISEAKTTLSTLLEIAINIFAALIIFLITLPFIPGIPSYTFYGFILIPILLMALHPKIFIPIFNYGLKLFKKPHDDLEITYIQILYLVILFILFWLFAGVSLFLLTYSFYQIPISLYLPLIGIFCISWVLGFLFFISPGGLGVREGILAVLFALVLPVPIALILAVLTRLWMLIGELLTALIFWKVSLKRKIKLS